MRSVKRLNLPVLSQGWKKIEECLGEYTGVKALWLEGNGLEHLENLDKLTELRCLYAQQNCITELKGLENNVKLDSLNVNNNSIRCISDISHIKELHTLQVANNRLSEASDIEHLRECTSIGVLDLQNNKLEDPACLEVLAAMPELRVLQLQGNPLTRKIKHYRKTVISRCHELTYLDDRPVFEDERRTTTAWAHAGASHKLEKEDGEVTATHIAEAFADGSFKVDAAHEAEKKERAAIRQEKEDKERNNREAFQSMLFNARVQRIAQVLSNVRLLEGVSEEALAEMANRCAANNVHTNVVCGFAKEEKAVEAGSIVKGLYFIAKGRVQFQREGKPVFDGGNLQTGQYFGEPTLCTGADFTATADVVCKEYVDMYLLSKDDLLEVADMYDGTLEILQNNRSNALKAQWHECKPWRAYELVTWTPAIAERERIEDTTEPIMIGEPGQKFPKEWYGKNELAKSSAEFTDDNEEINPMGVGIDDEDGEGEGEQELDGVYKEAWQRVQEQKRQALAEANMTEAQFEEHRAKLRCDHHDHHHHHHHIRCE